MKYEDIKKGIKTLRTVVQSFKGKPGQGQRYTNREIPHELKVMWARLHKSKHLLTLRHLVKGLLSEDPWAFFDLLHISKTTKIYHERVPSRTVVVRFEGLEMEAELLMPQAGAVRKTSKLIRKKMITGEPLGPEDYELGLQVPPGEPDEELVQAFGSPWDPKGY